MSKKQTRPLALVFLSLILALGSGCSLSLSGGQQMDASSPGEAQTSSEDIPAYSGEAYTVLEGNVPDFTEEDLTGEAFESYSRLDSLGRCGTAFACLGPELMPTEERGDISSVKPTGWHSVQYDFVDGKSLYNRCHLIGYQLTAENANKENLITGTRYLNVEGMLPFENLVADYVKETENHVLYRVTPIFEGNNLVASGVQMEAMSVEDNGEGVCFNVYCYNVQPGVVIDYATGDSWLEEDAPTAGDSSTSQEESYVLNTSSKKFHRPDCSGVDSMSPENRQDYTGTRQSLIDQG